MAIDILSIPAMTAGVERLFSQCKIMLTDRRNRLHIDGLEAVECMKSWEKLSIGFPQVVVTQAADPGEVQSEDEFEMALDLDEGGMLDFDEM
jgi:hypothetical protein